MRCSLRSATLECPAGFTDISHGRALAHAVGGTHFELVAPEHASDETRRICRASEYTIARRFEGWGDVCLDPPLRGRIALTGWCGRLGASLRPLIAGIERADSVAFDFHKWAHVPYDAGLCSFAIRKPTVVPSVMRPITSIARRASRRRRGLAL